METGHIYSLVSYNNFGTNFINVHPCEYLVRYSFSTHEGDWRGGEPRRFGWNAANPPLSIWMDGSGKGGKLPPTASFCEVDAPNVMVLTFKKAEDDIGYILRLIETEGKETTATVHLPYLALGQVYETNLVEENQRVMPSSSHSTALTIKPFSVVTLRLTPRV